MAHFLQLPDAFSPRRPRMNRDSELFVLLNPELVIDGNPKFLFATEVSHLTAEARDCISTKLAIRSVNLAVR